MGLNNEIECITTCKKCGSENVYFSRKQQCYVCEDCEAKFTLENEHKSLRIFLSYGHDDNAVVVEEIRKLLLEKGHNPWVDKYEIKGGKDWRSQITNGILNSDDFLAFITNHSTRKPGVCLDEIAIALGTKSCPIQSVLLEKDATVPSSISTKQWTDLSEWKQKYQQGEMIWKSWLAQMTDEIVAAIENPSNVKKSAQIDHINKTIHPIIPENKLKQMLYGDILSREWLFLKVREWYDTNSKCLLLIGSPGAGKSVLCAQLSHYMAQCAGLFFLEWNNAESRILKNILISIVFQLCCNIDDYRERIVPELSYIKENFSEEFIINRLLLYPLNSLIDGNREARFVIIDAIDEFEDEEKQKAFTQIKRLIDCSPNWLRWIITSRPISDSLHSYFNATVINVDNYVDYIRKDIMEFCKNYLDNSENVEKVVSKSNGSFVYAKELVEAINHRNVVPCDLDQLPSSLSAIYMSNFKRILDGDNYIVFRPFISLLLVAQEPIESNTIKNVLDITDEKLAELISRLKPFINIETNPKGQQTFSIYHKSFSDWLFSQESSSYKVSKETAHHIFAEYVVKHMETIVNDEYLSKHAYTHLRNAKEWVNLDYSLKKELLLSCIIASDLFGNLSFENQYLTLYSEELEEDMPYLKAKLHYLQKTNSKEIETVAEKLLASSNKCKDDKSKFEAVVKASIGLFYAGKDFVSHELLKSLSSEYKDLMEKDDKFAAMYAHAISLTSHDFDFNEDVVSAADVSARLNNKQNNSYTHFVALVNKFDALMGCGKIYQAYSTALTVFRLNEEKYFIHVDDILQICYANLLQTSGRVMEALSYYERGLSLAKKIHKWDYLYGSIWRELAIARFGDCSCLNRLKSFIAMASETNYKYLVSLGECFYVLSVYLLEKCIVIDQSIKENLLKAIKVVSSYGFQGHMVQVEAAAYLRGWNNLIDKPLEFEDIFVSLNRCQGIKGCPDVINAFLASQKNNAEAQQWYEKYLSELIRYKQSYYDNNYSGLSLEPKLNIPYCSICEAKCCYDGAYLEKTESEIIEQFVTEHQDRFDGLQQNYIVQGTWQGLEHLKKTATKDFEYKGEFPAHFNNTRCVFCNDEGMCMLQVVATDIQMHPWAIKPRACWSFPIHGIKNGKIIPPPKLDEPDPNNIGPEYPGYVTCLPCGKAQLQGESWRDIYKNEVEYYLYLMKSGQLQ